MSRMFRIETIACLMMLACGFVFAQEHITSIPGGQLSASRERDGIKLIMDYFRKNGTDKSDSAIAGALLGSFFNSHQNLVQEPRYHAKTPMECEQAAQQALQKAVDTAFPKYTDEELKKLAEKKHTLYKVGERVHVNFSTNNQVPRSVEGVYYGTTSGLVKVGNFRIRLDDMANVTGNKTEIERFSPDLTERLRNKYIEDLQFENAKKREEFINEKKDEIVKSTIGSFSRSNEEAGYTCFDGVWLKPADYLTALVGKARNLYAEELLAKQKAKVDKALANVRAQVVSQEYRTIITPDNKRINPKDVLEAQAEAERLKAAALAKKQAEAEARKREAEERAKAQEEAAIAKKEAAEQQKKAESEPEEPPAEMHRSSSFAVVLVGMLIILGVIGAVIVVVSKVKGKDDPDKYSKYFKGTSKVEEEFWGKAEADPENFKYVAYKFPSLKEATSALQKLSYITVNPNGDLKCLKENLLFGVYQRRDGAVAYVGGTDYHYAPWREATAVLPELEGAEFFKVSTEPSVMLDVPDIDKMASEQNIKIENLGIEDVRDSDGGFLRRYKYRAESKDMAMLFLANFQVNEEGIVVEVETPEGILGKDEHGIFVANSESE